MLTIEGIEVFIGENQVLRDLSLRVGEGERVAVLGANGAGKTTLIRTILGLIHPVKGRILLNGEEIQGLSPHQIARLGLACVPEGRRPFQDMTVLENLRMGAYVPRARGSIDRSLQEITGLFPILAQRLNQRAGTLSGGEQQMLSIGRALMSRPQLLLVDELSMGLGPLIVREIYRVLRKVGEEITLLLVEQSVELALRNSERAYVMETGRIVREAPSSELLEDPAIKEAYLGL
jgi:branched-chain amino acid transport system ATP-binding protein